MSDSRFPLECFVCGEPIENEDELVIATAGRANEEEFTVPCHRECTVHG